MFLWVSGYGRLSKFLFFIINVMPKIIKSKSRMQSKTNCSTQSFAEILA